MPDHPTRREITIAGIKYPYWLYHSDQPRTIVLLHGFRGTHHGLDLIASALPTFRLIVPDLPGFGDAPTLPGTHNLESYIYYVKRLVTATTTTPPILLGHSFGSIVAAGYAAEHQSTITKLILVNPVSAPALKGPKAALTRLAIFYYWLGRMLPAKAGKIWLTSRLSTDAMSRILTKSSDKTIRRFVRDQHRQYLGTFASTKTLAEVFYTSVSYTVRDFAEQLKLPILIIAGTHDEVTALSKQRELANELANAQLEIIESVGHLTHYETPAAVATAVTRFLQ